jgi:hypothetical protein
MFRNRLIASTGFIFVVALGLAGRPASAAPVLDGVLSPGEWGSPIWSVQPYVNGTDATGGVQDVKLYWQFDATKVYGAVVGDPTQPSAFTPANIYLYSSTANTNLNTNTPGTYGDNDDVLIEGNQQWGFGHPSAPFLTNAQTLVLSGNVYSAAGVSLSYNASTLTEEFSIDRSILGNYDSFRFGGQLYAYEFNTGSGDRQPGAIAAVPEPSGLGLLGVVGLGLLRRRRRPA